MIMAKYSRFDPRNKKGPRKTVKSDHRRDQHMESKYFRQMKNVEMDEYLQNDMEDYLEDYPFA